MFIVPLPGDSVETEGGVKHTVLSYAAYKDQPAVYVDAEGASAKSIQFSDIKSVNGTPVALTPGKVFRANSLVKRKIQLPQPGDKVLVGETVVKVKGLKLRANGRLTNGMLVFGEDQNAKRVEVRVLEIERLERANGDTDFSRGRFRSLYADYLGHKNA
jgi:hypothetical protein